jgi:hypothetical protein
MVVKIHSLENFFSFFGKKMYIMVKALQLSRRLRTIYGTGWPGTSKALKTGEELRSRLYGVCSLYEILEASAWESRACAKSLIEVSYA